MVYYPKYNKINTYIKNDTKEYKLQKYKITHRWGIKGGFTKIAGQPK